MKYIIKKVVEARNVGDAIRKEAKGDIIEVYEQNSAPITGFQT